MVNTGRPSRGCNLCRTRRIKCDEGRPGCRRCARSGKHCPGYPDETELLFRNYTASPVYQAPPAFTIRDRFKGAGTSIVSEDCTELATAEQQIYEAAVSSESSSSSSPNGHQPGSQGLSDSTATSDALVLTPPLLSDVEDISTGLYFSTYICSPRLSHNRDDFYFLPKMFATAQPDSCLHQAVKLIGLAVFANRWNPAGFQKQIRAGYARAIQATNNALASPVEYLRDETLMAVWLLGSFEAISGYSMLSHLPDKGWQSHTAGTQTLVRMRGIGQLSTTRGTKLFRIAHAGIQIRALFFGEEMPPDFQNIVNEYYWSATHGSQSSARLVSFHYRVTKLYARSKKLGRSVRIPVSQISDLVQEGEELAESMCGWSEDEDGWQAMPVTSVQRLESTRMWIPHKTHTQYYYSSILVYLHWFRYNLARAKLHEVMVDHLRTLQREHATLYSQNIPARIEYHQGQARAGITDFLGGIAFALGDIDERGNFCCYETTSKPAGADGVVSINTSGAQRLILPLYILRHAEYLTALQSEGIQAALLRIGRELDYPWTCSTPSYHS